MKRYAVIICLFIATIMAQLPIWAHPELFLLRDNDLENFFTPLFILYKTTISNSGVLPLWNPLWFGGQPLISDPQALVIYPTQLIYLLLPISLSIITNIWIHSILAACLSSAFFSKYFSEYTSTALAICYILSTRLAAAIEAGHYGIILAWAWIPGLFLAAYHISKARTLTVILSFALVLSLLVQAHTITAMLIAISASIYALTISKQKINTFLGLFFAGVISFGLLAIVLIPQLAWQPITTRNLLLIKPEVYPVWQSKLEFIFQVIPELGRSNTKDTEKVIGIGVVLLIMACISLLKLRNRQKLFLTILGSTIALLVLNNISPFAYFVTSLKFIQLMRVTTRIWPIVVLLILFFVGTTLNSIRNKYIFGILAFLSVLNSYLLFIHVLARTPNTTKPHIENIYAYLKLDPDHFRVYCIDRCFRQKLAAENGLELIDGYATLTQRNYYQKSWSLFGGYWDYYTLAIPPFGISESLSLSPNYELLGEMSVKYIVSPTQINSSTLTNQQFIDSYYVYTNLKYRPRIYITNSSRDVITPVQFKKQNVNKYVVSNAHVGGSLMFSEIYSPGWYANGYLLSEAPSNIMSYELRNESLLNLEYKPKSFVWGKYITYLTSSLIFLILGKKYFSRVKTIIQTISDSKVYIANREAQTSTSKTRKKSAPRNVTKLKKAI